MLGDEALATVILCHSTRIADPLQPPQDRLTVLYWFLGEDNCVPDMQRSFEERLGQTIGKMDDAHKSRSAALDESLRQVHSSLLDIAISISRLEDKLDREYEKKHASGRVYQEASESMQQEKALAAGDRRRLPTETIFRHEFGGRSGVGSDPGSFEILKSSSGAKHAQQQDLVILEVKDAEDWADIQSEAIALESGENCSCSASFCRELQSCDLDAENGAKVEFEATAGFLQIDTKLAAMDKKLEKITASMGIRSVANLGDDEEDRKRLKEKLKQAIELDKQNHVTVRNIVSDRELWMEYIFGVCSPEPRTGKRGSRSMAFIELQCWVQIFLTMFL